MVGSVITSYSIHYTKLYEFGTLPKGYDHKYVYSHFGYNLKVSDMQAAVGCAQLDKFPSFVEKRKENRNNFV